MSGKRDEATREAGMVVIHRDSSGTPTVWCDPEMEPLVRALNDGGLPTVASCSGHGVEPPSVALADGRWLFVYTDEQVRDSSGAVRAPAASSSSSTSL